MRREFSENGTGKRADLVCAVPCACFFLASFYTVRSAAAVFWYGALLSVLFLIGRNDILTGKIRNVHNLVFLLSSVPSLFLIRAVPLWERVVSFLSMTAAFFVTVVLCRLFRTKFPLGGGDVRMIGVIALLCGFDSAFTVLIAFAAEAVYAAGIAVVKKKTLRELKNMKVSFGPFLALGTALTVLFQLTGLRWY